MPYIKEDARFEILSQKRHPKTAGELNFAITMECNSFLANTDGRYQDYNDVIGALEACKLEFYRRAVAPYENVKIKENGDVY